jgi:hypothetical protein
MSKRKVGDKITSTTPSVYKNSLGKENREGKQTITKVYSHGVRTKEYGYIRNSNITSIESINSDVPDDWWKID